MQEYQFNEDFKFHEEAEEDTDLGKLFEVSDRELLEWSGNKIQYLKQKVQFKVEAISGLQDSLRVQRDEIEELRLYNKLVEEKLVNKKRKYKQEIGLKKEKIQKLREENNQLSFENQDLRDKNNELFFLAQRKEEEKEKKEEESESESESEEEEESPPSPPIIIKEYIWIDEEEEGNFFSE